MGQTAIQSDGLASGCITRSKLNTTLAGSAVVAKVLNGVGIAAAKTGVDTGTGDVTLSVDQTFTPTWTGAHTFSNGVQLGAPTGGNLGAGTINVATGIYLNGAALATSSGANPTGSVGLTAVNGTATTFMRSDGAPAIDQTIAPTWTGKHTWTQAVTGSAINASNSNTGSGAVAINASTSGTLGGTSAAVYASSSGAAPAIVATNSSTGSAISASTSGTTPAVSITQSGSGVALSATYNNAGSGNAIYATSGGTGATLRIQNLSTGLGISVTSGGVQFAGTGLQLGSPTGGDEGAGTINLAGGMAGLYFNGTALQAIAPTWTGAHTWTGTGTAITATGTSINATISAANSNSSTGGPAIQGVSTATTGSGWGVYGLAASASGAGVYASNSAAGGIALNANASGGSSALAVFVSAGGVKYNGTGVQVGSPTGGDLGAGTINVASGYYVNGVNQFQTGTFTGTATGISGTSTFTATYSISGKMVLLFLNFTGTSTSTALTMTGLPSALQPATLSQLVACSLENASGNEPGMAYINPGNGTITFGVLGSGPTYNFAGFTASNTKGFNGTMLAYSLQ